jgi:PKHD-type hydroxylase
MLLTGANLKCSWAWWDSAFNDEQLQQLKQLKNDFVFTDGLVGDDNAKTEVRQSDVFFVYKDQQYSWIFETLDYVANSLNQDFFNFDLYELNSFQYTKYDKKENEEGGYYNWHWDMYVGNRPNHQRKLSLVMHLSEPGNYEGGDLILAPGGNQETIELSFGKIIVFPSFVNHCVTPVTRGTRETLVAWYTGPNWK